MSKINFVQFLMYGVCFFFMTQNTTAQNIKQILNGTRWGLTGIYEHALNRQDTLLLVRDCANEYYEFLPDGTLVSSYLERDGTWTIQKDSILIFRRNNHKIFKKSIVQYYSEDSIMLRDEGKNQYFLEVYERCLPTDSTYVDNREIYQEFKTRSLVVGGSYLTIPTAEIGFALTRLNWNNTIYGNSIHIELAPQENVYGISLNTWWDGKFLAYGLAGTAHTDNGKILFGVRPMLGLTAQRLFNRTNRSGISCHLMYGYTMLFSNDDTFERTMNRDAVHLRFVIPFQKSDPQIVRKSVFYD